MNITTIKKLLSTSEFEQYEKALKVSETLTALGDKAKPSDKGQLEQANATLKELTAKAETAEKGATNEKEEQAQGETKAQDNKEEGAEKDFKLNPQTVKDFLTDDEHDQYELSTERLAVLRKKDSLTDDENEKFTFHGERLKSLESTVRRKMQAFNEGYIISDLLFPVEVVRPLGEFYPKDHKGKQSEDLMYKAEARIHDPSKRRPQTVILYGKEKPQLGYHSGQMSLHKFKGRQESSLRYEKITQEKYEALVNDFSKIETEGWKAGIDVEIVSHVKADWGNRYNYEAYLLNPITGQWDSFEISDKAEFKQGIYDLEIVMKVVDGAMRCQNIYTYNRALDDIAGEVA